MVLKLYTRNRSPPCWAVILTARALGVKLEEIETELYQQRDLTPEFLKLNPQHTLPTLVEEDGKSLWDSHAIMPYLVEKYGKDDSLYPKDPYRRAVINQRLHFDSGVLWTLIKTVLKPILFRTIQEIPSEYCEAADEAFSFVEKFLEGHEWIAGGDHVSVADFSNYTSLVALDLFIPCDPNEFPNIAAWIKKVESLPYFDPEKPGYAVLKEFMSEFWKV